MIQVPPKQVSSSSFGPHCRQMSKPQKIAAMCTDSASTALDSQKNHKQF